MKPKVTNRKDPHPDSNLSKGSRLLVRCGDCESRLEMYYTEDSVDRPDQEDDDLEINGVYATRAEWREILKRVGL